jgi:hypothetical protein
MVALEEVVIELLEPRPVIAGWPKAGCQPSRNSLALEDANLMAALHQAQGGSQPQGASPQDGDPARRHH